MHEGSVLCVDPQAERAQDDAGGAFPAAALKEGLGDRAQAKGISAVQTKVPRLVSDADLLAELDRHVVVEAEAQASAAAVPIDPEEGVSS